MNKILKYSALALIALPMASCEDWMDTEQQGSTAMENFYSSEDEALQAIYAIYDKVQEDDLNMFYYKNLLSDDAQGGGGSASDNAQGRELDEFRFGAANTILSGVYEHYYQVIYCANLYLQKFPEESCTDKEKQWRGEALALRAQSYLELVSLWGPVPLVLEPLEAGNYNQPVTEEAVIYAQIEEDLENAIKVLPLKSQYSAKDKGRVSKGTAQAWLGKTQLYEASPNILNNSKKYAEAAKNLQAVITSNEYDLIPDFRQVCRASSEFGDESVFEVSYAGDKSAHYEATHIIAYCGPRSPWFSNAGTSGLSVSGWGFCNPDPSGLLELYKSEGDYIRMEGTILDEEMFEKFYGVKNCLHDANGTIPFGCDGLIRMKYGAFLDETVDPGDEGWHCIAGTNYRITRYADVLLMAAEACLNSSDPTSAKTYMDKVRERVGLSTKTAYTMDDIKKERRMELAFEFVRYQDLIRWGDAETVLKDQGKKISLGTGDYLTPDNAGFKSYNRYLPYPETELTVNDQIHQHDGY